MTSKTQFTLVGIKINSIQEYIFQSNLLKENIGASHITNEILFGKVLKNSLIEIIGEDALAWDSWKVNFDELHIYDNLCLCEIIEIGGGGALILFKEFETVEKFIKKFSLDILCRFPGLKTSFSYLENFDESQFNIQKKQLFKKLETLNKSGYLNTIPIKLGIMQNCEVSQYSAEVQWSKKPDSKIKKISRYSLEKINYALKSLDSYKKLINTDEDDKFVFSSEIEKLGQNNESGYIAVVHIDGNGVGKKVAAMESIADLRSFSAKRAKITTNALQQLIKNNILNKISKDNALAGIKLKKNDDGKIILPILPLLHGGDDVTFICEGRLGIYLAESFLNYFTIDRSVFESACAGVAIVKTKFPFYKAYTLAEELCAEAKVKSRETNSSYLSFFYSASTFSGTLSQIRERTHTTANGKNLYNGPYLVSINDSLTNLKAGIRHFKNCNGLNISKNKVMKLREILNEGNSNTDFFIKDLLEQGFSLPLKQTKVWTESNESSTPFFDQIELMDFYPNELL